MKIHHLNCGTFHPVGGRLVAPRLVCHCLIVEAPDGLALVDTGLGLQDVLHPTPRLSRFFVGMMRPDLDPAQTAASQIRALGFSTGDVRDILLTHLDFDHAGGLDDFPRATVHLLAAEADAARDRSGWIASRRRRPMQLTSKGQWKTYDEGGSGWFGFRAVRGLEGLPPEILLVPLVGHSEGHTGVAVDTGSGWILHAGDAYFSRDELRLDHPGAPPGLAAFERTMDADTDLRKLNQRRLRELIERHGERVHVLSSHDPAEFEAAVAMSLLLPPQSASR